MAKAQDSFDDIIVGSGLTGLLIANQLRSQGREVMIFEQKEVLGGQYRGLQIQNSKLPSDLGAYVKTEQAPAWSQFLSSNLEQNIEFADLNIQPRTYDNAHFKNFVGFGDLDFKTINYFADYNSSEWMTPNVPASDWVDSLTAKSVSYAQTLNEVTGFEKLPDGQKGFKVIVNGGKEYTCERVFFTPSPTRLLNLIAHDAMNAKFVSRLAKTPAWMMAALQLNYKPEAATATSQKQNTTVSDFENHHAYFLMGHKNEFEPCLGRFFKSQNDELYSYWFTLISPEQSEDNEYLGNAIKNIKKTLKRIFPEVSDLVKTEKISISTDAYAEMDLKLKNPFELPEWDGFYLASHLFSSTRGTMAHVDTALQILGLTASPLATTDAEVTPNNGAEDTPPAI